MTVRRVWEPPDRGGHAFPHRAGHCADDPVPMSTV